jgi:peroxiredoxin (alkyl hydroperoxide reductase subunit C)
VVLFFYPLDFTFVCPSEILGFDRKVEEFRKKDCELIGVSVDSHFTHLAWRDTEVRQGGIGNIRYPLVSDLTKEIARAYGVLHNDSVTLRGLFLIDREGVVRHAVVNDLPLGRNVDEALRMLDALKHTEEHGEVCPANWREGEEAMKPTREGVASYLTEHTQ